MTSRQGSKRNSISSTTDGGPALKRHKADDTTPSETMTTSAGATVDRGTSEREKEGHGPAKAPDLSDAAIAHLEDCEKSCLVDLPYPDQIRRYKNWQDVGKPHDDFCIICNQGENLIFCYTCRRSYHPSCMTNPHQYPGEDWWCPVCVLRGWDKWDPESTLFAMEIPPEQEGESQQNTPPAQTTETPAHIANHVHLPPIDVRPKVVSIAPVPKQAQYATPSLPQRAPLPHIQPIAPAMREPQPPPPRHAHTIPPDTKQRSGQPRARKSRYSNFLPEVDSAISIIYRELESTSDLRSQLMDTQTEVRTLSQELRIRDNQLLLANKINASRQVLEAEVVKLREELRARGSESGEVEFLRQGYRRLEIEIAGLRDQLRIKDREKDEWRDKLRRLIEPGSM